MTTQPVTRTSAAHEKSLGITKRISPSELTWHGDIRLRFTDFQVYEIGEDSQVVHLTESTALAPRKEPPPPPKKPLVAQEEDPPVDAATATAPEAKAAPEPESQAKPEAEISEQDSQALEALAGSKFTEALKQMYKASFEPGAANAKPPPPVTSDPLDDKATRAQIHELVRNIFKSRIDTSTGDAGAIEATCRPKRNNRGGKQGGGGGGGGRNNKRSGPAEKPADEYIHFTLFKENRDTLDAVQHLARALHLRPNAISYAGTKDRRASTAQRCAVRNMTGERLGRTNGRVFGVTLGNFSYHPEPIHLGQLMGNEFIITVKNCQLAQPNTNPADALETIRQCASAAVEHTATHGFINYFGHQRFGTHATGTHEVGQLILQSNFEGAVNAILHYDVDAAAVSETDALPAGMTRDMAQRNRACAMFLTGGDADAALRLLPRRFSAEAAVMRHLSRSATSRRDFTNAIGSITRGLRTMYLHAYQSLVWNYAASRRWELYGARVVEGDLVMDAALADDAADDGLDTATDDAVTTDENTSQQAATAAAAGVRVISAADAAAGTFSIFDVVLPTPGFNVLYPGHAVGAFYAEFMGGADRGGLDPHDMRRRQREFTVDGRYRRLVGRFLAPPTVHVQAYAHDEEQLWPTDLDTLRAAAAPPAKRARESGPADDDDVQAAEKKVKLDTGSAEVAPSAAAAAGDDVEMKNAEERAAEAEAPAKNKVAVVFKFQLGKSAYATVALRELMGETPA